MAYRKSTGRPMKVAVNVQSTRDMIRRWLRLRGKFIKDLAPAWNVHPTTAYRSMYSKQRPLTPNQIEAAIAALKIDALDATRLRLYGARESGWLLDPQLLKLALKEPHER